MGMSHRTAAQAAPGSDAGGEHEPCTQAWIRRKRTSDSGLVSAKWRASEAVNRYRLEGAPRCAFLLFWLYGQHETEDGNRG